jgi:putative nucleotidyltransferase with HDIG domain
LKNVRPICGNNEPKDVPADIFGRDYPGKPVFKADIYPVEGACEMDGYFIKKGREYYTVQDIYDYKGMLLLRKGQKITNNIKCRLDRFRIRDLEKPGDPAGKRNTEFPSDDRQSTVLSQVTEKLRERLNIRNERIFRKANDILIKIIFESKTKPWWIYVNALSNYVDWLYTHSIDVAVISLMMAAEMGYSKEELTNLGIGTLMHDVGKLLIPKSIIQKSEKLTDMEMSLMRQHCELGVSSLEGYNLPKEYLDIVMQHHERLDGSGYPNGLKGDEICRNAKIVMIADTVDGLSSHKPYSRARSMETAIMELKIAGEKYPQEFISILEEILWGQAHLPASC